ncbi:NADPH-dependent assimilatory sulfite reductase hemoprotein subunit [Stratiformator vulcanicus]|uniref:Sulfite reductase [ferredoxin] n=1 Tax=Stratiformator vulcanicus TaxID=2527980 RepID=A0A517R1I0_9PLAN|nr:NADPH-dependent assimilatory sulfite reductase hemoprotein subunit [Stratiformator vulcanicus]QDT37738.1 Sulfite reductase [ferredoxin] [Stratiformator vulcanicus]
MADQAELSKLEGIKASSNYLRGSIAEELQNDRPDFSGEAIQLLKHHGTYQQDNRDLRKAKGPDGKPLGKQFSMMVRTRIPGGRVTAEQFLAEIDLGDLLGEGTVRITTRQGFQLHGVPKGSLRETIRKINETKLTTFAACGDVSRNVMACPAPFKRDNVREEMQRMAFGLAELLRPQTKAYYDLWLRDDADPQNLKANLSDDPAEPVEPVYGEVYLPRKFKMGIALPEDNCIDVYTQDLGFLAIVEEGEIVGYNVLVGGGMGMTPAKSETFPALAKRMAYVTPDQVMQVATAVVKVQRDHGNRADRKQARMKYLIAKQGLEWFKAKVEEHFGASLPEPHPADVTDAPDHMGWNEQGDGNWFLGLNIENGRVADFENGPKWKTALRELLQTYGMEIRLTALQGAILCDIKPEDREDINAILKKHDIKQAAELSLVRRYSMACPALPMCGLAVTESERIFPTVIDDIEKRIAQYGLAGERITIHMTGCPNGCARPYTPDIGLVGKAKSRYTVYLGGNDIGTRLAYIYKDLVREEHVADVLSPALQYFKLARNDGETFGDFCARVGQEDIERYAKLLEQEAKVLSGELGALSDDQLAEFIEKFADDLSAEQLESIVTEGQKRTRAGANGRLGEYLVDAEKRFDVLRT